MSILHHSMQGLLCFSLLLLALLVPVVTYGS